MYLDWPVSSIISSLLVSIENIILGFPFYWQSCGIVVSLTVDWVLCDDAGFPRPTAEAPDSSVVPRKYRSGHYSALSSTHHGVRNSQCLQRNHKPTALTNLPDSPILSSLLFLGVWYHITNHFFSTFSLRSGSKNAYIHVCRLIN